MMGNNSKLCCFKFLRYHNSLYFLHRYVNIHLISFLKYYRMIDRIIFCCCFWLNCEIFLSNFSSACHQFFTFPSLSLNHWSDFNYMNHNYCKGWFYKIVYIVQYPCIKKHWKSTKGNHFLKIDVKNNNTFKQS